MTYDSLVNHGDYLSAHYLAEVLPKDLKAKDGLLARWAETEERERRAHAAAVAEAKSEGRDPATVPPRVRTPREGLRALHGPYFASRADFARDAEALAVPDAPVPSDWAKRLTELHLDTLHALGFAEAHEQPVTVHRSGHDHPVQVLHTEPGLIAVSCGWTDEPDAALDPDGAGRLLHPVALEASARLTDAKALADFLFECDEPPRYVLILVGGVVVLADRLAWHEGRYLAVGLDAALNRRDVRNGGELDTVAALFGADSLRVPEEGGTAPLAGFVDKSGKHAVGVSTELREGLRLSVEWIANEVLARLRDQGVTPEQIDEPARLAKELGRESLRYLYRILFLLYAEAQPTLGILPADDPEYARGYGLQRLGDLVVRDLVGERSRGGFHLYESLDLLFQQVQKGHREFGSEPEDLEAQAADRAATEAEREAAELLAADAITRDEYTERIREADRARKVAARSADVGLRFEPLRSDLFKSDAVRLISADQVENPAYEEGSDLPEFLDTRLRNETLHKVLRRLMLTKGKGRERGGFISYAQLGINQLGAVYEGLMSYTGFIADEDLYEVAKGGDASGGSWMIPAGRVQDYPDEVFVERPHEETGRPLRVVHPRGSFVYRLAGRDRQTSASYYTPKSLTEVTVELALKHRLDQDGTDTSAEELLGWKICEPALGSGAFLNEAIDQVAAEYLRRRERELGRRVDPEARPVELQKAKAYIALHNAYGVDLNATAVELAEVSLWLNSMHPGMRAPWFGLHLRRGNSLIGAGRKVYGADALPHGQWLSKKVPLPPTELPFRDGELPDGAVHHFLLPALGWGAVAGEPEAKKLAEDEAKALGQWRRGVQKAPKCKPFEERDGEPHDKRQARYDRWAKAAAKTELGRLQAVARRAEFLWSLVAKRLELSERKVSRRIDVWGADWLEPAAEAADKQRVLDDLTAAGTPYWRLKTVMDAWCALWFWPLDQVGLIDGTDAKYAPGEGVLGTAPAPAAPEPEAAAVPTGPAPGDLAWRAAGLFDDPDGEQDELGAAGAESDKGLEIKGLKIKGRRATGRQAEIVDDLRRRVIPLKTFADWLDFLELTLGTRDAEGDAEGNISFLNGLDDLPVDEALPLLETYERSLDGVLGMDSPFKLAERFPWLDVVEDIAGTTERDIKAEDGHGFFHWELHFAHVFRGERGGFDLQVGNPPWVRPDWDEAVALAEFDPWFKLSDKPSAENWRDRKEVVLSSSELRVSYFADMVSVVGVATFLSESATYPLIAGTRPDLYRAFMCRVWRHLGAGGAAGLIHPDTHFGGVKEGRIRESAYRHLRLHAGFVNVGNWAFEASRTAEFGVHIYGSPQEEISFYTLNGLYGVEPLLASLSHDGEGEVPGMKYSGGWDLRPHRARVITVNDDTLAEWRLLTGDTEVPYRQAALLHPLTTEEQGAIAALSAVEERLGQHDPRITIGMFENLATKKLGLYRWDTTAPSRWDEVILQGSHLGIATSFSKAPNIPFRSRQDWSRWDLTDLSASAVPNTNYVRDCDVKRYEGIQDRWLDYSRVELNWSPTEGDWEKRSDVLTGDELLVPEDEQRELLRRRMWLFRPYTYFYRIAWRAMVPFNTERSLFAALIPPGAAHVHTVQSMALRNDRVTVLNSGFWASLPFDYLLRITGRSHLQVAEAKKMPYADPSHPLASALLLRALRLNSLTDAYAPLWRNLYDATWPGYEDWAVQWPGLTPLAGHLKSAWGHATPLRTEYERRAALVEIDALVAVWLGMSADELIAIHKARYAILADRESQMWFDASGRQLAKDPYAHGHGQTKEHYEQFVAYDQGERTDPPVGYTAPFYKANREKEMRAAHAVFEGRLRKAQEKQA
ncbi:class I SAM-dependent DNA methyltransferase [Streptomyces sp. NPDC057623]|uniref:class I SAM-dependent DNA methyltransferase n=1 Tax=Streptomyces sp. NPDC057623 TaxID=3346187 RepID=UPI00368AA55E